MPKANGEVTPMMLRNHHHHYWEWRSTGRVTPVTPMTLIPSSQKKEMEFIIRRRNVPRPLDDALRKVGLKASPPSLPSPWVATRCIGSVAPVKFGVTAWLSSATGGIILTKVIDAAQLIELTKVLNAARTDKRVRYRVLGMTSGLSSMESNEAERGFYLPKRTVFAVEFV